MKKILKADFAMPLQTVTVPSSQSAANSNI